MLQTLPLSAVGFQDNKDPVVDTALRLLRPRPPTEP